jgi:hypothetical protein
MGALSSWGGLALIHHAVVRYSAYLVGETDYQRYLVLGDDIVIEGKRVADSYLAVCAQLGISLSLPKSYTSANGLFNFASQVVIDDINISPISFRKALSMKDGWDRLTNLLTAIPRGLLDLESGGWLQLIARFVLPRAVYSAMEAQRLEGVRHPAIRVLGALLCGTSLSGDKSPFNDALTEKGGVIPLRLLLKPGLDLFSLKLSDLVEKDKKTEFLIMAHKLLDRAEELLSTRYAIAREAFLKDVSRFFSPAPGSESFLDAEGDIDPTATINFQYLIEVVTKPNVTALLPRGRLVTMLQGQVLKVLCLPFLASFTDYFVERMKVLYDEARLSRAARERNKILEGNWWEQGFKFDFGLDSRVQTLKTLEKDTKSLELTPKIVLDMHDSSERRDPSQGVLDYVFLGLLTERSYPSEFTSDEFEQLDDFIPESTKAHKDKTTKPQPSSGL